MKQHVLIFRNSEFQISFDSRGRRKYDVSGEGHQFSKLAVEIGDLFTEGCADTCAFYCGHRIEIWEQCDSQACFELEAGQLFHDLESAMEAIEELIDSKHHRRKW